MKNLKHLASVVIVPYRSVFRRTFFRARRKWYYKDRNCNFAKDITSENIYFKFEDDELVAIAERDAGLLGPKIIQRFIVENPIFKESN